MFQLAEALHKFVYEIRDMPASEFRGWLAYYGIKDRNQKRQESEQKSKSASGQKGNKAGKTFG